MCTLRHYTDLQSPEYAAVLNRIFGPNGIGEHLCRKLMMVGFINTNLTETARQKSENIKKNVVMGVVVAFTGKKAKKPIGVASYKIENYKKDRKVVGRQLTLKLLCAANKENGGVAGCGTKLLDKIKSIASDHEVHVIKLLARREAIPFYERENMVYCEDACAVECKPKRGKITGDRNMSSCLRCVEPGLGLRGGMCKWTNQCPANTHSFIHATKKKRVCVAGEKVKITCGLNPNHADVKTGPLGGRYVERNGRKQYCSTIRAYKKPRKQQVAGKVGRPKKQ